MDLSALRALVTTLNVETHGVPVTVTWIEPGVAPITTRGIWDQMLDEAMPYGTDLQRSEPRRQMALSRTVLASVPRGTLISAPERTGGVAKTWKVDGLGHSTPEMWRVILVPTRPSL